MTEGSGIRPGDPNRPAAPAAPPRRKAAGGASRLALAGGAVGVGFVLVGAMAAAATHDAQAAPPPAVHRVVVATAPAAPTQLIVMLPQNVDAPVTTIEIPNRPAAPASVLQTSQPVTQSNGS